MNHSEQTNLTNYKKTIETFYLDYQPPKGFRVPENFPICRGKSVLILKEDRRDAATKSGVILIENANGINKFIGRIYACGPECKDLAPGMRVMFNAMADQTVIIDNGGTTQEFLIMSDYDVFVVMPEDVRTMTRTIDREKRRQFSYDEMPDIKSKKEIEADMAAADIAPKILEDEKKKAGRKNFYKNKR